MILYLAGPYSRRDEFARYRDELAGSGIRVPARWLLEEHDLPVTDEGDPARKLAMGKKLGQDDYEDVRAADVVIVFTAIPAGSRARGGLHVEFGLAMAWGKHLAIVGPRVNVFHYLVPQYETWDDCLKDLMLYASPSF